MREYFGQVSNEIMTINNFGEIVEKCWLDLSSHYQNCILDEYVVMPNHFHGIVIIDNEREENGTVTNRSLLII
jgi:REP element-mobilizing transposase RayT